MGCAELFLDVPVYPALLGGFWTSLSYEASKTHNLFMNDCIVISCIDN